MDLSALEIILRLVLGVLIGFTIGLTGIGGGALVIPALTIIFDLSSTAAVGTASLYAFITKIYAGYAHFRLKTINFGIAVLFLIGALPANIICSHYVSSFKKNHSPEEVLAFDVALTYFIAIVMVLSVALMLVNLALKRRALINAATDVTITATGRNIPIGILSGIAVGALIGSTSVSGVIVVPLLILLFKMPTTQTVGTSILIALVLTLVTALIYGKGGEMDYATALIMSAGSIIGVHFGSRLCSRIPERPLQIVVIGIICVSAILMVIEV